MLFTNRQILHLVILTACFIAIISAIIFRSYNNNRIRSYRPSFSDKILEYGKPLPNIRGKGLSSNSWVEVKPGVTNLLICLSDNLSRGRATELAKYAEMLHRQYKDEGLVITLILSGEVPEVRDLYYRSQLTYQAIQDLDGTFGKKLGLLPGGNGFFLFEKGGSCQFSTDFPISFEDLRQLIAVDFLNIDPFNSKNTQEQPISEGQQLKDYSITEVNTSRQTTLEAITNKNPTLFIFFTAECSICSLPEYLKKLKKRLTLSDNSLLKDQSDEKLALIFDFNFSRSDVLDALREQGVSAPSYIAKDQLIAIKGANRLKIGEENQAVSVLVNSGRFITSIFTLDELSEDPSTVSKESSLVAQFSKVDENVEIILRGKGYDVYDLTSYRDNYILSDFRNNRLVVLDKNMNMKRVIGKIGSGPGRVTHPGEVGVSSDGTIYVVDSGNKRIEKFSIGGEYIGEFKYHRLFEGFAVSGAGEVYLGHPETGSLVTVYSSNGKVMRSFGKLKQFSEVYGDKLASKNHTFKNAINRVRFSVDNDGYIYLTFRLAPLLQKYSPDGSLIFEHRLEGAEIENLTRVVTTDTSDKYISSVIDGIEEHIILLDPIFDSRTNQIHILLADGSSYITNRKGEKVSWQKLMERNIYPFMSGIGANNELIIISLSRQCYRLKI